MATKDKNGNWIFDDEDEQQIAIGTEVRYRAGKRLRDDERAEKVREACAKGEHKPKDGKCEHCGAEVKVEKVEKSRRFGLVR